MSEARLPRKLMRRMRKEEEPSNATGLNPAEGASQGEEAGLWKSLTVSVVFGK